MAHFHGAILLSILGFNWSSCDAQDAGRSYILKTQNTSFSASGILSTSSRDSSIACAAECQAQIDCVGFSLIAPQTIGEPMNCTLGANLDSTVPTVGSDLFMDSAAAYVKVNESCTSDAQCLSYPAASCQQSLCSCTVGTVAATDRTACLPGRNHSQPCVDSVQCPKYSVCVATGYCSCPTGYNLFMGQEPPCTKTAGTNISFVDMRNSTNYTLMVPDPRVNYGNGVFWWCVRVKAGKLAKATVTFWDVDAADWLDVYESCSDYPTNEYSAPRKLSHFMAAPGSLPSPAVSSTTIVSNDLRIGFATYAGYGTTGRASVNRTGFTLVIEEV